MGPYFENFNRPGSMCEGTRALPLSLLAFSPLLTLGVAAASVRGLSLFRLSAGRNNGLPSFLGGFHFGRPQIPLLRLLTTCMSAFEGTSLPPLCGRHKWKPQKVIGNLLPRRPILSLRFEWSVVSKQKRFLFGKGLPT